uniref:Apt1 domain-containing protein n=1 Tax=Ascaris lumbricoides TaxID=6252 RepID=A0A0M3HS22_ASCLU
MICGKGQMKPLREDNTVCSVTLEQFWDLESIGIMDEPEETDGEIAINQFVNPVQWKNNRYEVRWPWKSLDPPLQTKFALCLDRLKVTAKRLQQDNELMKTYNDTSMISSTKG